MSRHEYSAPNDRPSHSSCLAPDPFSREALTTCIISITGFDRPPVHAQGAIEVVVIELTGQSLLQSFPLPDSRWQPLRPAADVIYHVVSDGVKEKPNESSPGLWRYSNTRFSHGRVFLCPVFHGTYTSGLFLERESSWLLGPPRTCSVRLRFPYKSFRQSSA